MSDQIALSPPRVRLSPPCQRCSGATVVQRITASRPGHEHWTLRCSSCGNVHEMQVVSGASQSEQLDWFERDFVSPK
jgi:uncharacterized Zn finger protein